MILGGSGQLLPSGPWTSWLWGNPPSVRDSLRDHEASGTAPRACRAGAQTGPCVHVPGSPQARELGGGHHEAEAPALPSEPALGASKPGGSVRRSLIS